MRNSSAANPTSVGWQKKLPKLVSCVRKPSRSLRLKPRGQGYPTLKPSSQNADAYQTAESVEPIRVAIVIAAKLERLGWSIVVDGQEDMGVAGLFSSFDSALTFLVSHPVDVALVDETMLTPVACDSMPRIAPRSLPQLLILARHPLENDLAAPLYPAGSRYLLKGLSAAELLAAIREAARATSVRPVP